MADQNYTTSFVVDNSAEEVYKAINSVRDWWSRTIQGDTDKQGAVFYYDHGDIHHCTIKVEELTPNKKVVWKVLDNMFSFTKDKTEWIGSSIVFDISLKDGQTELTLTHVGLTPADECYQACYDGWGMYFGNSLKSFITTGKGLPYEGEDRTESEAKLTRGEEL